jgi:hypothetical protein
MRFLAALVFALPALPVAGVAPALAAPVSIRVVSAVDGSPLHGATVSCIDRPDVSATTDPAGRAALGGPCARVRCVADAFLPGEEQPVPEGTLCRLAPGVVVAGRIPAPGACASGCAARLLSAEGKPAALEAVVAPAGDGQPASFRLASVPPGRWRLEVARDADGWNCAVDLGVIAPGTREVIVNWREPAAVGLRVLGTDDAPRPGVPVRAFTRLRGAGGWGALPTIGAWRCGAPASQEAVTGEAGRATIALLDPAQEHLLIAGNWTAPEGLDARLLESLTGEPVTLRPRPSARVVGRLLDAADRPVPCAAELRGTAAIAWLVEALPPNGLRADCGADGALAFFPVLAESYRLAVRGDGTVPFDRPGIDPRPGETLDLGGFRVPATDALPVVVRDAQKRPVAGARVVALADAGLVVRREAETDGEGRARIAGLPMRGTIALGVDADGFAPWRRAKLSAREAPVVATLERGAQALGRVVDPWGNPVEGARVLANPRRDDVIYRDVEPPETTTSKDGSFALKSLAAGAVSLVADARGFERSDPLALDLAAGDLRRDAILTLRPAPRVHGRVLGPNGAPFAGARVVSTLWYMTALVLTRPPVAETVSGPEGAFELPCKRCKDMALLAFAPGYGAAAQRLEFLPEGSEVELRLAQPATLRALGPAGRSDVRGVQVEDGAGVQMFAPLDADGRAELTDLSPGEGTAQLAAQLSSRRVPIELRPGETTEVTLGVDGAELEGTVTVDGVPWPGAVIGAVHADGGEGYTTAFSDDVGRYWMTLPPGDILVNARAGGGEVARRIELAPGSTARLDLPITPVFVEVLATDSVTHLPLRQVNVWLKPLEPSETCSTIGGVTDHPVGGEPGLHIDRFGVECDGVGGNTRDDGTAQITLSRPGPYSLRTRKERYESRDETIAVRAGVNPLELRLVEKSVLRTLRAVPPEGIRGRVACRCGDSWFLEPAGGEMICTDLPAAPCELFFRAAGVGGAHVSLPPIEPGEVPVPLVVPPGGAIAVANDGTERWPTIVDDSGVDWSEAIWVLATGDADRPWRETLPEIGLAFVVRDLPPGRYTVTRQRARSDRPQAVEVTPGGMAFVR